MRIFHFKHLPFLLVTAITLIPVACKEASDSENAVQQTLDTLLSDLQVATSGSNAEVLEAIISSANRIRTSSQPQTHSKNLLLSTAKEKLAQLQFQTLSAETTAALPLLHLAENQAIQVALLRAAADAVASTAQQSATLVPVYDPKTRTAFGLWDIGFPELGYFTIAELRWIKEHDHFTTQLTDANTEVSILDSKSQITREAAQVLREQAEQLLDDAEYEGIVEGHATYKSGVKVLRKSQQADLSASAIELQKHMHAKPMRDDARVELEAIASILNGMQHTEKLLKQLQDTSIQNAADFRALADEFDTQTAQTMNEAIARGSILKQQWNSLATLIQDAMKGSGRNRDASREAQQTAGIWKLDLEWTLGQIEETKRSFLLEELRTLNAIIDYGIVTSSDKWRELSALLSVEIEQATIQAISAYENAKLLASNIGPQGDAFIHQLDTRLAILQGLKVPVPQVNETATYQPNPTASSSGFESPQALIIAFNKAIDITSFDGSEPVVDIRTFHQTQDAGAEEFITFWNDLLQSTGNVLIAIRNNMGEAAVTEFLAMPNIGGIARNSAMKIELSSIVQTDDGQATAREESGKVVRMRFTPNGWKIFIASNSEDPDAAMAFKLMSGLLGPMLEITNSMTEQINNGQITTIEELNAAMMAAMENMNPF